MRLLPLVLIVPLVLGCGFTEEERADLVERVIEQVVAKIIEALETEAIPAVEKEIHDLLKKTLSEFELPAGTADAIMEAVMAQVHTRLPELVSEKIEQPIKKGVAVVVDKVIPKAGSGGEVGQAIGGFLYPLIMGLLGIRRKA